MQSRPQNLSEQEIIRRIKLNKIKEIGIESYPAASYHISSCVKKLVENYKEYAIANIAGRIMRIRIMGNASFSVLQDHSSFIQLYVRSEKISNYNIVKKLLDIGDIIGVKGFIFKTSIGEISMHVKNIVILSKSLRPLPQVKSDRQGKIYDVFSDIDLRHRLRYVDLIVNESVKTVFCLRSRIIETIREFLNKLHCLEVETPILQNISGGASALPFITFHKSLNIPLYLRIANELYLKRVIVGGFEGIYEFARDFRNEGIDRTHNPEFTILELYVAYKDYYWMMDIMEKLLKTICMKIYNNTEIKIGNKTISFTQTFPRIPIDKSIEAYTGINISGMDEDSLRKVCKNLHLKDDKTMGKGKLIDNLFSDKCENKYIQPTFIIDHPIEMSPLTKKHRKKRGLTERFEFFINGNEIANSYSELNDPIEQLKRFKEQLQLAENGDDEAMFIDYDFIRALEFGMPPNAGIGIGIDRLVMFLTKTTSIQEILLFPQSKTKA
ncbi:lysyl-tRNA synthetase [Candidatus Uzinura diaspidicola str. ASNER]|uniref:Lysine--tRNA ligase n=1 Tax=Candidatus Uzinura diaspidicola str. ASNER TaxID=1133592 RepID=L7VJS5_9FLAO|nr:lysyl-tRNA synthetase [Candidatus Uzinura diaspidicola str. ASNER]